MSTKVIVWSVVLFVLALVILSQLNIIQSGYAHIVVGQFARLAM